MKSNTFKNNNILFLVALIIGLGISYLAVDQAYSTGNAFLGRRDVSCFDSDGGLNYSVAGYTGYVRGNRRLDYCVNDTLVEGWCSSRRGPTLTAYRCPYGCKYGACLTDSLTTKPDLGVLSDRIKVCWENCSSLPTPVFKVCPADNLNCSPKNHYNVEYFLDNRPLLTHRSTMDLCIEDITWAGSLGYTCHDDYSLILLDGKSVIKKQDKDYEFQGTNKFTIYQDNFNFEGKQLILWLESADKKVYEPKDITVNFNLLKTDGNSGSIRLINEPGFIVDSKEFYREAEKVTSRIDKLTGKQHVNFSIYILPQLVSSLLGGEGNFYLGNSIISINYVNNTKDLVLKDYRIEVSHEYTHAIQFEKGPFNQESKFKIEGNTAALHEGLADAVGVYLAYIPPEKLSSGNEGIEGCVIKNPQRPHDVGRCIFKHLHNTGVFTDKLFWNIFNPTRNYYFQDSTDLSNRNTCDSYSVLFSEATGTDMTSFMINTIKGNCSPNLQQAKENLGFL